MLDTSDSPEQKTRAHSEHHDLTMPPRDEAIIEGLRALDARWHKVIRTVGPIGDPALKSGEMPPQQYEPTHRSWEFFQHTSLAVTTDLYHVTMSKSFNARYSCRERERHDRANYAVHLRPLGGGDPSITLEGRVGSPLAAAFEEIAGRML